jgi:hypothetical protein
VNDTELTLFMRRMMEEINRTIEDERCKQGQEGNEGQEEAIDLALDRRIDEALSNPEFQDAVIHRCVREEMEKCIEMARPRGFFEVGAMIRIDAKHLVFMENAKRDHLLSWALLESNEKNLEYIKSRLEFWKPEHATLADVEKDIQETQWRQGWQTGGKKL